MATDLVGQKFKMLTVISRAGTKGSYATWNCSCDCGGVKIAKSSDLKAGRTGSCGCQQYKGTPKDITGQKYNRLTAIEPSGNKNYKGSILWKFSCDCGSIVEKEMYAVTSGATKSCGCYAKEVAGKASITHGNSGTLEYVVWNKVKARIFDPTNPSYGDYGGRGLTMSPEFVQDMKTMYEHLGDKPDSCQRYTIGRKDNDVGYVFGNIHWETYPEQAKNRSMMVTNSSGFTGVVWSKSQAVARWHEGSKQCTKGFSISKFGLLPAFALACEYRIKMIEQLILAGEAYTKKHGQPKETYEYN